MNVHLFQIDSWFMDKMQQDLVRNNPDLWRRNNQTQIWNIKTVKPLTLCFCNKLPGHCGSQDVTFFDSIHSKNCDWQETEWHCHALSLSIVQCCVCCSVHMCMAMFCCVVFAAVWICAWPCCAWCGVLCYVMLLCCAWFAVLCYVVLLCCAWCAVVLRLAHAI